MRSRRLFLGLLVLGLTPALALMLRGLGEPLHGEHVFRQAHVAANVEKFARQGLSLRPAAYNQDVPGALFDFPAYSWTVAAVCRATGAPAVPAARAISILILVLCLATLDAVWRATGLPRLARLVGLLTCAWAPLDLFYFQVPLPDGLALLLALLSVLAWLKLERAGQAGPWLLTLLACALLATLIKNPLYLPFALGLACDRLARRGPRGLWREALLLGLALLVAVVGFKLYSNAVNRTAGFLPREEAEAFFGTLHDRLRPRYWRALVEAFTTRVCPPATLGLVAAGLVLSAWRPRARASLRLGLLAGSLATLALFFNRHREHSYYQLPFVPVLASFAGGAPALALALARRARSRRAAGLAAVASLALLALVAVQGASGLARMQSNWEPLVAERGAWIAAHSAENDFVVYVLGVREDNWDPAPLYFAQRDGHNLARSQVGHARLAELHRQFAGRYARFLVYCPPAALPELEGRLARLGAQVVADGQPGRLYRLEPAWLRPE